MNQPVELRWTRLRPDASLPQPATAQAAGLDLSAAMDSAVRLEPGAIAAIPCAAMALPAGYEAQVPAFGASPQAWHFYAQRTRHHRCGLPR